MEGHGTVVLTAQNIWPQKRPCKKGEIEATTEPSSIVTLCNWRITHPYHVYRCGATSFTMSAPRPIHRPSRALRTEPHESEPARSFSDEPSPLLDEEDDFHNKLSQSRRVSSGSTGGSFWRTSDGPAFSSAAVANNNRTELKQDTRANNKSSAVPKNDLQPPKSDYAASVSDYSKIT